MSLSELNWFIDLAKSHPNAPNDTQKLAEKISRAMSSNHPGTQLNRAFRSKSAKLQTTHAWLNAIDLQKAIKNKQCQITSDAFKQTLSAFNRILNGELATKAWSLPNQTGQNTTFSKTLEANALARYLQSNKILNYSESEAVSIASEILNVNADEVKRYNRIEPLNSSSEAFIAYEAVMRYGNLDKADMYFDVAVIEEDAHRLANEEKKTKKL